jgi:hypothetical protein
MIFNFINKIYKLIKSFYYFIYYSNNLLIFLIKFIKMGQCAAICSNTTKKFCEVNVEHISTHLSKRNSLLKYSTSPFYSNIIYLQIQIKKFLKRIKKKKSDKNN